MNLPASALERKFNGLVSKIQAGECVLVLGPRIAGPAGIAGGGVPIDEFLSSKLREDLGDTEPGSVDLRKVVARYERETNNPSACRSLIQELVAEFDSHATDLHVDLAALPFLLILTATPDRMMAQALRTHGKPGVQEAYYDFGRVGGIDAPLTPPTIDKPIVYSLFGRHDHPESMVLNDKNLLDYLVKITRESPPLPDVVRARLRSPSTVFLFVGFGFTNWWLRLLLKVLDITGIENRSQSVALEDRIAFEAAASTENTVFFESAGIYIQARDWNAMVKDLVTRIRQTEAVRAAVPLAVQPVAPGAPQGHPFVFLSYASEDVDKVDALRLSLQSRGIYVWQDDQNLRGGQNWDRQLERVIKGVDYFVFVQTPNMDQRDQAGRDGVYNRELKRALARVEDKPYAAIFLFHATVGQCKQRPEAQLSAVHRRAVDTEAGVQQLADDILEAYQTMTAADQPDVVALGG